MNRLQNLQELAHFWKGATDAATQAWIDLLKSNPVFDRMEDRPSSVNGRRNGHSSRPVRPDPDWESTRTADSRDDIDVGFTVTFTKTLSDEDVERFARASGDTNPLHLDDDYASKTRFGQRICHGTLINGLISAALARIPGDVIYMSNNTKFLAPVPLGERLTAIAEVIDEVDDYQFLLKTHIEKTNGDRVVEGEASVLVDALPEGEQETRHEYLGLSPENV